MKRTPGVAAAVLAVLAGLSACSGGGGGTAAFCTKAKDLVAQNKAAQASSGSAQSKQADVEKKAAEGLKSLAAKSPSEIKASAQVVSATVNKVVAAKDDPKKLQELFADKKFTDAEQKLTSYAKGKCNVDFNA